MGHFLTFAVTLSMAIIWEMTTAKWKPDSSNIQVKVTSVTGAPPLEVVQVSPSSGFIQTPGWGNVSVHPINMNSVVHVKVPYNFTAMVSMVHVNVSGRSRKCDPSQVYLAVYENTLSEHDVVWKCDMSMQNIAMRRQLSNGSDIFVHFRSKKKPLLGFRLFFTVNEATETLSPLRLGLFELWNCSVPNFAYFRPHFQCDLLPQCVSVEDERDCPYSSEECGLGSFPLGDYCVVYKRGIKTTWRGLQFTCEDQGMRMASLRRKEDYDMFYHYLTYRTPFWGFWMIAVGLHSASEALPDMYEFEMQNFDGTIAFYKKTRTQNNFINVCGSITLNKHFYHGSPIKVNLCRRKIGAYDVFCETPKTGLAQITKTIQLPSVNVSHHTHLLLRYCPQGGHLTRNFLPCDLKSCAELRASNLPSFACSNGFQCVPYTHVCDHRADCKDGSDESFCDFPPCDLLESFTCGNQQCVSWSEVCDGQRNCQDATDEDTCSGVLVRFITRLEPPAIVHPSRAGEFKMDKLKDFQCPETHVLCPGNGYCLPVFLRCNGVFDCLGKEDETDCNSYTCSGFYRCRGSQTCLHPDYLCDGFFQCPQSDDELLCDLVCPQNCTCYGLAFYCRQTFQAKNYKELRFLDGRRSGLRISELSDNKMLIHLSLSQNNLTTVEELHFPNLCTLDLSDNKLKYIDLHYLCRLPNLEFLSLPGNPLVTVFQSRRISQTTQLLPLHSGNNSNEINFTSEPTTTDKSVPKVKSFKQNCPGRDRIEILSLRTLDLSRISIKVLKSDFLSSLPNLQAFNISGAGVDIVHGEGFYSLTKLRTLDLRGCPMTHFSRNLLRSLQTLQTVYSDNYKICCSDTLPVGFVLKNCHAPRDLLSSCQALFGYSIHRIFLSVSACLALLGNASCLVHRVFMHRTKQLKSFDVFMVHLWLANFLMGVYLSVIAMADRLYHGTYLWEDKAWKSSNVCQMAGFLSLVSSEVSAFVICLITLDRFLALRFPSSTFHFEARSAQVITLCVWALSCFIAAVPLVVVQWQFYGQTAVCIPLLVGPASSLAYAYMFGVMIVANFILSVVTAAGQLFIYWAAQTNTFSFRDTSQKSQDLIVAQRVITVAVTDFVYWFFIGLTGILNVTVTSISSEVSMAMTVFAFPLNSAVNPILYTLNIVLEKNRNMREEHMEVFIAKFASSQATSNSESGIPSASVPGGPTAELGCQTNILRHFPGK